MSSSGPDEKKVKGVDETGGTYVEMSSSGSDENQIV